MAEEIIQIVPGLPQVGCHPLELLGRRFFSVMSLPMLNLCNLSPLVLDSRWVQAIQTGSPLDLCSPLYEWSILLDAPLYGDYRHRGCSLAPRWKDGLGNIPSQDILLIVAEEMQANLLMNLIAPLVSTRMMTLLEVSTSSRYFFSLSRGRIPL